MSKLDLLNYIPGVEDLANENAETVSGGNAQRRFNETRKSGSSRRPTKRRSSGYRGPTRYGRRINL